MSIRADHFPDQRTRNRPRGFTLIEAAIVTIIIGVGVVALTQLMATGTMSNIAAADQTTGINLARCIREMSLGLSFADPTTPTHWGKEDGETTATIDDVDDLAGMEFSPPIDARRQSISTLEGWKQSVTVVSVDPNRLTLAVPNGSTPASRVTVTITHNNQYVCELSWVAFDAAP